jgi:hypothetical protein
VSDSGMPRDLAARSLIGGLAFRAIRKGLSHSRAIRIPPHARLMKVCSTRGKKKPLNAFYKQKGGAQGRRGACKECFKAAQRAAWVRDPRM